jgi:ACS family hexuronate transporter-like MFS transporter
MAFLLTGMMGFLLVPIWLLMQSRIRRIGPIASLPGVDATKLDKGFDLSGREVLRRRKYWFLLLARALSDIAWYFFIFWLPGYFQVERNFDLVMIGSLLWIPYFCADIGAFAGAWASSALIHRGVSVNMARRILLITYSLLGSLGACSYYASAWSLSLAFVSIALFRPLFDGFQSSYGHY